MEIIFIPTEASNNERAFEITLIYFATFGYQIHFHTSDET